MLTIAISVLFGLVAFAALAQIYASVSYSARRARQIFAALATDERETQAALRARSAYRQEWRPELAAA